MPLLLLSTCKLQAHPIQAVYFPLCALDVVFGAARCSLEWVLSLECAGVLCVLVSCVPVCCVCGVHEWLGGSGVWWHPTCADTVCFAAGLGKRRWRLFAVWVSRGTDGVTNVSASHPLQGQGACGAGFAHGSSRNLRSTSALEPCATCSPQIWPPARQSTCPLLRSAACARIELLRHTLHDCGATLCCLFSVHTHLWPMLVGHAA
jgi:hypothetical protein